MVSMLFKFDVDLNVKGEKLIFRWALYGVFVMVNT